MSRHKNHEARIARRNAEGLFRYTNPWTWRGYWGWKCPHPGCDQSRRNFDWTVEVARTSLAAHLRAAHTKGQR